MPKSHINVYFINKNPLYPKITSGSELIYFSSLNKNCKLRTWHQVSVEDIAEPQRISVFTPPQLGS